MTLRSSTLIMGLLLATAAAGGGMLACSSAEEQPAEEPAPAPERSTDDTSPAPLASNTNSAEAPPADPAPAAAPAATDGGTGDGGGTGTGPGTGGGTGGGAGKLCEASSTKEKEDNNTAGAATAVPAATGSACGQLATKADVDFFKFTLPADTTGFGMGYNFSRAGLKIEVTTANGKSFSVGSTPELEPGQEYTVKVSTTGDGPVDYRWSMEIDK